MCINNYPPLDDVILINIFCTGFVLDSLRGCTDVLLHTFRLDGTAERVGEVSCKVLAGLFYLLQICSKKNTRSAVLSYNKTLLLKNLNHCTLDLVIISVFFFFTLI